MKKEIKQNNFASIFNVTKYVDMIAIPIFKMGALTALKKGENIRLEPTYAFSVNN